MDIDEEESQKDFSRERNKVKNQRHNYTIKEIKIVLTKYKEIKSVSETAKFLIYPEQQYLVGFKSKIYIFLKKIIYQVLNLNQLGDI